MSAAIETTGPDVESAVQAALAQLGLTRDQVQVEVLEEPQRRLLGLGNKLARVRVTPLPSKPASAPLGLGAVGRLPTEAPPAPAPASATEKERPPQAAPAPDKAEPVAEGRASAPEAPPAGAEAPFQLSEDAREQVEATARTRRPLMDREDRERGERRGPRPDARRREATPEAEGTAPATGGEGAAVEPGELDEEASVGVEVLEALLSRMQISATVQARRLATVGHDDNQWVLEVLGQELGDLIGHRGETLSSLQFVTRLIVSGKLQRRVNFMIDVEGYKSRREEMLRRLARRMAAQAIERGRTVSMEPMPPYERRIIHLALEDNPSVTTESVGEGEKRKVTIIPKKNTR